MRGLRERLARRQRASDGARWSVLGPFRGVLPLAVLASFVAGLLALGNLLIELFPLDIQIAGSASELSVTLDGRTEYLTLARPLRALRLVPADPFRREYQVDGSDSTNNLNYDPDYFSEFSKTHYYRFQAWLRDEAGYSRWRDLSVRAGDGSELIHQPSPTEAVELPLPQPFSLTIRLQRPETPRTLELAGEDGILLRLETNRNDRRLLVTGVTPGGEPKQISSPFLPSQWPPFLAELLYMLTRAAALALALPLLLLPLTAIIPGRSFQGDKTGVLRALPLAMAGGALALALYSGVVLFDRAPHILDAVSYYFQGKVLASGALAAPAPPDAGAFPTPFTVVHDGRWFSQYPPGVPALLGLGFLAGVPWLVEPILAAGSVLLVYLVGRRQYGRPVALLAALLMATSPFLGLLAGSYMSHVPTMFFASLFLYSATRYLQRPATRWAAAASIAMGATFLCRESVALLWSLPMGLFLLAGVWRKRGLRWRRDLAVSIGCFSLFGVAYLLYNWGLTGSPLVLPRGLFYGGDRFGFGDGVGFYGKHTLAAGLVNADEQLTSLSISLFGWPSYFTLSVLMLPFLTGRSTAWDRLHGAVIALFVLAFVGYFYHGIVLGPRYYFEALPSMVLLAARGFATLGAMVESLMGGLRSCRQADSSRGATDGVKARLAVLLLATLLFGCNFFYFWPRQGELYEGYSGWPGGKGPVLGEFVHHDLAGRVTDLKDALVTTGDWWIYSLYLAPMNSPRLDGDAVFALSGSGESVAQLRAAFPDRVWLQLIRDRDGRLNPR